MMIRRKCALRHSVRVRESTTSGYAAFDKQLTRILTTPSV